MPPLIGLGSRREEMGLMRVFESQEANEVRDVHKDLTKNKFDYYTNKISY